MSEDNNIRENTLFRLVSKVIGKRMWRTINKWSSDVYYHLQPIFSSGPFELPAPSPLIVTIGNRLFELLEIRYNSINSTEKNKILQTFCILLDDCPNMDSLLTVYNDRGYNILQMATDYSDIEVIDKLIIQGACLDNCRCSLPLQIACYKGDYSLVKHFIKLKASIHKECGMCWPKAHKPVRHVPSRFHFLEADIFICDSNSRLPLMCAIEGDHVNIVRELCKAYWPLHRYPLHWAATNNSFKSLQYLTQVKSDELEIKDDNNMTPLLSSVSASKNVIELLLDAGANVHCYNRNGGVLHHLYSQHNNSSELFLITKLFLGYGLDYSINILDENGNTSLQKLVLLCNYRQVSDQNEFDMDVEKSIELLLMHNIDVNYVNNSGVTALHKLLLTFDFVLSNNPRGVTIETLPQRESYIVNMNVLNNCINILIKHNANMTILTSANRSPILIILQAILGAQCKSVLEIENGLVALIKSLCPSIQYDERFVSMHNYIVIALSKLCEKFCVETMDNDLLLCFMRNVYCTLMENGFKGNICGKTPSNLLAQTIRTFGVARTNEAVYFICDIIICLLQHGCDPNIEPYGKEPEFCMTQSCLYLKKSSNGIFPLAFEELESSSLGNGIRKLATNSLLNILCNSVSHATLYSISKRQMVTVGKNIQEIINYHLENPRTLKESCRISIYKLLCYQLHKNVSLLPLPNILKNYLLNII